VFIVPNMGAAIDAVKAIVALAELDDRMRPPDGGAPAINIIPTISGATNSGNPFAKTITGTTTCPDDDGSGSAPTATISNESATYPFPQKTGRPSLSASWLKSNEPSARVKSPVKTGNFAYLFNPMSAGATSGASSMK
jgi:hypothetical protein